MYLASVILLSIVVSLTYIFRFSNQQALASISFYSLRTFLQMIQRYKEHLVKVYF